jgi:RND family efflux transporter MFP subunit
MLMIMKNKKSVLFAIGMSMLLSSCSPEDEGQEIIVRPVRTVVVSDDENASVKTFSGVSRSAQESKLSFKVSGTVIKVPAKVGDKIKAGTVIASLDTSTYELQLQQAQASVEQSRAAARNAQAAYQRTRALYANNNASLGDLDTARANTDSVSAQLRAANKSLQLAQLNLSYTNLKVDIDCAIDSISVEVNENISTNSEIARVNCSDELEIEVAVPGNIIGDFKNGKTAIIKFDALPNAQFSGKVTEVGVGASGVGATFPVTMLVGDNQGLDIRPGLAASVAFANTGTGQNDYLLPLSALVQGDNGTFVYLVEPVTDNPLESEGVIVKQLITTGSLQTGGIEVTSGLIAGHRVVIAGVSFVRNGLLVSY